MYEFDQKPNTILSENTQLFLRDAPEFDFAVLVGRNNCGKSYLLKTLAHNIGERASYLGPARYQNFHLLGYYTPNRNRRRRFEKYQQFVNQWQNQQQNIDNSPLNLQQAIAELSDEQRSQLIEIMQSLLNSKMEIRHTVENNSMSQQYISVDGHNISYTSSGYRLIATLVTSLLDDEYDIFLIDEPELGISPEAQGLFSDFLFDREIRRKYFGHIKSLVIATHSTVFLDRATIRNNYFVEKRGDTIDLNRVETIADINRVHFFLLGNRLETLYMPSAIVIVEGKTDYKFIERIFFTQYENKQLSLIQANGDARIKEIFNVSKNLLGDIQKSPYRDRIFVVLDKVHGPGLVETLVKMGLPRQNIIVWSQNGIEYYYPKRIIQGIYHSDEPIEIERDIVRLNGLEYTKDELANLVIPKIDKFTEYDIEFSLDFLNKIDAILI